MGWLFGRKKVPKVPFPEGRPADGSLQLTGRPAKARVIEPEHVKAAAGVQEPLPPFDNDIRFPQEPPEMMLSPKKSLFRPKLKEFLPSTAAPAPLREEQGPLYIKMDVYQQIVQEMSEVKGQIHQLTDVNKQLEESEYNEENNFVQLRKSVKGIHDRLLLIDRTLFKPQGD